MRVINRPIIQVTEGELYDYWLENFSDDYSFEEYEQLVEASNIEIIERYM